jgi:hypothetical protein
MHCTIQPPLLLSLHPCSELFSGIIRPAAGILPKLLFAPCNLSLILCIPHAPPSAAGPSFAFLICDIVTRLAQSLQISQQFPTEALISKVMNL